MPSANRKKAEPRRGAEVLKALRQPREMRLLYSSLSWSKGDGVNYRVNSKRSSVFKVSHEDGRNIPCAYHVCKLSHAQTIGLDALVGQDVVHQHQFAVVEPDLHALGLL